MPSSTTDGRRTLVRGLGEIAFRVDNLDAMQKFYEEVIGSASSPAGRGVSRAEKVSIADAC
jgi:catechol-2,3-dioxygenase